jgi:aryl-alcohol dehydrogenase-like predicted oxidoreductase
MALAGRATAAGTARYAARFTQPAPRALAPGHYREALDLTLSSIGVGMALGEPTDEVDALYRSALVEAVHCGCNVLDTSASYRAQRSEVALGRALTDLTQSGEFRRDELVITTKGGFIAYRFKNPDDPVQYVYDNFIATGAAEPGDLAGGIHCMAPAYLSQQIAWSLRDIGLRTIDIYLIQNPETQLAFVDRTTLRNRLQLAFARLEEEVAAGRIGCYGVSSGEGLRRAPLSPGYMSLEILVRLAAEVAGPNHHCRVVQLPLNAGMVEAATFRNQPARGGLLTALDAAKELGLVVFAGASLAQGRFSERTGAALVEAFPRLSTYPQQALQFARSLPGITTALFGSTRSDHVRENLAIAALPPEADSAQRLAHALTR